MTTITQSITALPDHPDPATDTPTEFSAKAAAWVLAQKAETVELETFRGQVNTVAGEVNDNATTATAQAVIATAQAVLAATSEDNAAASAAFKGVWSTLTGAVVLPYSVEHNGVFYIALVAMADITVEEPGISASWGALSQTIRETRTSNTILGSADAGKVIEITSGTFSQTFLDALTLGESWHATYRNVNANITFTPAGADTIDVSTCGPGEVMLIMSDGISNFTVIRYYEKPPIFKNIMGFTASGTFTALTSGLHRITAVGPGGSGGVARTTVFGTPVSATGGAAGGVAQKAFHCIAGTVYTITIGAAGTSVTRTTDGASPGVDGGNTSVTGFGVSLTANGGAGGTARATVGTLTGATGGAATGGDLNVTGGASGGTSNTSTATSNNTVATGGGAPGIRGVAYPSGSATVSGAGTSTYAATGGAGCGGESGDATSVANQVSASGGGGSMGASSAAVNVATIGGIGFASLLVAPANGAGGDAALNGTNPGSTTGNGGAGVGGKAGLSTTVTSLPSPAMYGGSGAVAMNYGNGNSLWTSAGGIGAGSGGMAVIVTGGAVSTGSLSGGSSIVTVEW